MNLYQSVKKSWEYNSKNKIILGITGLIIFCCSVSFCCNILTPSNSQTTQPTQNSGINSTQVFLTAQSDVYKYLTATAERIPTQTASPTLEPTPTFTLSPEPTSVINNIPGATCITNLDFEKGRTVEVIDGDTIRVSIEDKVYSVRYIGIDTPETGGQFYSLESKLKNSEMVLQTEVLLFKDTSNTDQYGRLLRYVVADNLFVNYELVKNGYAKATPYPPDTSCSSTFTQAENSAKNSVIGIWNQPTPVPVIVNTPSNSGANCHPAYPTVCIPPPPPDLDCGDISYRRFQVLPPDPHRFDGNGDGVGCESN
jgi:micrococcal nuclease